MNSRLLASTIVILLPNLAAVEVLRRPIANVEAGNAALKAGNAEAALGFFEKATKTGAIDPGVQLNVGLALSALGKHDEATQAFLQASGARDTALKATAFYNLGNGFFRGEKWGEAIEAYKRSLTLAPKNANAKWNLEIALQKKVEQDKKEQDKKDDKQKQDDKPQDDKQKQDDKPQDDKPQDDKPQDDKQKQDDKPQDDKQKQKQKQKQDDKPQDDKPQDDKQQDDKQPQEKAPSQKPEEKTAQQQSMEQMNAVLDSLEKSPKDLERMRAQMRAVRRQPPAKDW